MTDEADRSVVLAELQVALFRECDNSDWVHGVGHSPVLQILLQHVGCGTWFLIISSAWGLSLFKMIFNMSLLEWLMRLIVLAELQVALFRECDNSDWVHGVGHSPVLQILLQISVKTSTMVSPPAWTSSPGILSTPADFPFFSDATAISTSSRKIGCRSSSGGWLQSSIALSPQLT